MTTNTEPPADVVEAYSDLRRLAVEHLKDHPNIERTHRLMKLPQSIKSALSAQPAPSQSGLVEALKPFAKAGELFDKQYYDDFTRASFSVYSPAKGSDWNITGQDLFNALQALQPKELDK